MKNLVLTLAVVAAGLTAQAQKIELKAQTPAVQNEINIKFKAEKVNNAIKALEKGKAAELVKIGRKLYVTKDCDGNYVIVKKNVKQVHYVADANFGGGYYEKTRADFYATLNK